MPEGLEAKIYKWLDEFPDAMRDFENVVNGNEIFMARTKNVGVVDAEMCKNYGVYGANLRAAGVKLDLRKDQPYSIYDRFDFDVPTGKQGDSFDRYEVRHREMAESAKIIRQALEYMPSGPVNTKIADGNGLRIRVPKGMAYARVESTRGEYGYLVVSDGEEKPYRVAVRGASYPQGLYGVEHLMPGTRIDDVPIWLDTMGVCAPEIDR